MIDCHTHIFPPQVRNDREPFLKSDQAFRLLYNSAKARIIGAAAMVEQMDRNGVDRAVVFGFPWSDPDVMSRHNDYVGEAASRFSGRLLPFVCVNPLLPSAAQEVDRCLAGGMRGAGELAFYTEPLDSGVVEILEPIASCCRTYQVPLMLHTNERVGHRYPGKAEASLKAIYEIVRAYPENRFILAHWGGGIFVYELLKKEAREVLSRVAYDTAASPFLYDPMIYSVAVQIIGPKRILFGSDYPLISPDRYFQEMAAAGLTEEDQSRIKGRSAIDWLNLQNG
ncbi:MAG: amidohydrolase [Deltaproteobacteria bacterium]|nr:MAG: amidohydrolase [Deltaproteobacteria bacterium]